MTGFGAPVSVRAGVKWALEILGGKTAETIVGRGARQIAYWGEDGSPHHIHAFQALRLDRACREKEGVAPILAGYRAELRAGGVKTAIDPVAALMTVMVEVGHVSGVLNDSLADKSAGGRLITARELREILREAAQAQDALDRLVDAATVAARILNAAEG